MAKWRVISNVEFDTTTSRSSIKTTLGQKRTGKEIFTIDKDLQDVSTRKGQTIVGIDDDIRFNNQADADQYAQEFKDEFVKSANNTKVPEVVITKHICPHNDNRIFYNCKDDKRAKFSTFYEKTKGRP